VEMGDAALGLAMEERKAAGKSIPKWAVVRNCSDPQINGPLRDLPRKTAYKSCGRCTTTHLSDISQA